MSQRILLRALIALLLLLTVVACSAGEPENEPAPASPEAQATTAAVEEGPDEPVIVEPSADKSMATGRVIDEESGEPIGGITIKLAEVYREGGEGAYVLDTAFSPSTITDEEGGFVFADIEPGEYVIVVGDIYESYQVIADDSSQKAAIWEAQANQVMEIGELAVTLP